MRTLDASRPLAMDVHDADAVRPIGFADIGEALAKGARDFWAHPSHYIFLVIIYPVVGFVLAIWSTGGETFPLLYPIATGFALVGPLAAIGLYELSRRREAGLDDHPSHAFAVLNSPAIGAITLIAIMLAAVFMLWIATANAIYQHHFPGVAPANLAALFSEVFTTERGWQLLLWGNLAGFCFALFVLATTVVAFPLLVDRGGSPYRAIIASLKVFAASPIPILAWGLIVAALLFIGSLPLFVGLAVVLPILGHATWHLYRATMPQ